MIEAEKTVPAAETVEAAAFLSHLNAIAGLSADHALAREAVAACKLGDREAFTGPEMAAIERALFQKVQLKLAISNDPDVDGLKALVSAANRLASGRLDPDPA